ncbi:hypothetical protein BGX28_006556 [Mortierella sp. GBA30]|nr:hypothetical protein BGX28_006556 [Mortierella sp. GBA30]
MPSPSTIDNPRDKIFALPEIIERIAQYLSQGSITSCLRVSKAWHDAWLPIIWHTIDNGWQWRNDNFKQALYAHGDLIRNLECQRYDDISPLINTDHHTTTTVPLCKNLISLQLPKTDRINQPTHVQLIRQNPHLRNLSISFTDSTSQFEGLINAVSDLQFLRRLAFDRNDTLEASTLETILTRRKDSLQELSFKTSYFLKHPLGSGEAFASTLLAQSEEEFPSGDDLTLSKDVDIGTRSSFKNIVSLYLDGVACTPEFLLNLSSMFPNLTLLSLKGSVEVYYKADFGERLAKRCPRIKHLDISEIDEMDDTTIANLIRAFPRLETLKASHTRFGNESINALIECAETIKELNIDEAQAIPGRSLQRLLESCRQLRVLEAWNVDINVAEMMAVAYGFKVPAWQELEGASIGSQWNLQQQSRQGEWICSELEILSLLINYDSDNDITNAILERFSISEARQFIFNQLSRLTKLRQLTIRAATYEIADHESDDEGDDDKMEDQAVSDLVGDSKDDDASLQPLDLNISDGELLSDDKDNNVDGNDREYRIWTYFSPRSGLTTLQSLKNLRVLDLSPQTRGVGLRGVQWMCRNWPNLREIRSLDEDDDVVHEWLKKHRPDIVTDNDRSEDDICSY